LKPGPGGKNTMLAWLRQSPAALNPKHMLEHLERLLVAMCRANAQTSKARRERRGGSFGQVMVLLTAAPKQDDNRQ
jgi:hypothetical protein